MILGITGSSGAGKSTVCEILEKNYQFKILNADKIAKKLSQKGTPYLSEIVENFGQEILLPNQELDRKKLAQIIYYDTKKRNLLNQCTLKYIKQEIEEQIQQWNINQPAKIAIDAPLLFEAKLEKLCDYTIAVVAQNKKSQLNRIVKRDKIEEEHAKARIQAQPSNAYYEEKCDYTIKNDNELKDIEEQLEMVLQKIKH